MYVNTSFSPNLTNFVESLDPGHTTKFGFSQHTIIKAITENEWPGNPKIYPTKSIFLNAFIKNHSQNKNVFFKKVNILADVTEKILGHKQWHSDTVSIHISAFLYFVPSE